MRDPHPDDVRPAEDERNRVETLSPHDLDPYYQEAFCALLDPGMGVCCR